MKIWFLTKNAGQSILASFISRALAALACASLQAATPFDYAGFLRAVHVPTDFSIELAAGEPMVHFPMFACADDEGRLFVAESSGSDLYAGLQKLTRDCRVSRLEDTDGDGRFDEATPFQDRVTFPMGLAWRDGRLYLADPPELVALTDTDGDGRADKREVILTGFGHTDNGSLHGLTFGPDGRLYFTMGTPDGWKLPRGDGTYVEGTAGALFRCRPDGSRLEVLCRGFENLVEVEFMPGGEIIGTDNWFQQPAGGYRDALVDCSPGGLYPYAPDRGTPLPRTGIILPPLSLLPAVAHSGVVRPRGVGLPTTWRNSILSAQHNTRKVVRHELHPAGSTFVSTNVDFIVSEAPDFHPSDVLEDMDGSLLIVDTGGWYVEHCPTGRIRDSRAPGGIYRVRWNQAPKISDPGGRPLKWSDTTSAELAARLHDRRTLVADRAAAEMVRRGEVVPLRAALRAADALEVRLRALWALAQIPDPNALSALYEQLGSVEATIVTAAARALALRANQDAGEALLKLLDSTNAPVRRAVAETLAVCGGRSSVPRLINALVKVSDDFEAHTCIAALLALADESSARGLIKHSSPLARRAGLNLLDQPPFSTLGFSDLVAPLADEDAGVRDTARRLLERHPDWARSALPWLQTQLVGPSARQGDETTLTSLLTAFQGDAGVRHLISELLDPARSTPDSTRAFLLDLLPALNAQKPEAPWLRAIVPALTNVAVRAAALNAATAYPQPEWEGALAKLAEDPAVPAAQRLLAARAASRQPVLSAGVFALALASLVLKANPSDRFAAVDLLTRARLSPEQLRGLLLALRHGGPVSPDVLLPAITRSADHATRPALADFFTIRLQSGWSPTRATFEQALGLFGDNPSLRQSLTTAWEENNATRLRRLIEFTPLLTGGDAERGREWFATATCAGCHRVGERGGFVGPDLTRIGAIRSGGDLLESILYPSSSLAQGFEPYLLKRSDGEELSGSLIGQGPDGVSLRDGTGRVHRVRAAEVSSLDRQELSAMPEGLEELLTRAEFSDLLAYLQSLK